jgi:hypothetical protein
MNDHRKVQSIRRSWEEVNRQFVKTTGPLLIGLVYVFSLKRYKQIESSSKSYAPNDMTLRSRRCLQRCMRPLDIRNTLWNIQL